MKQDLEETDGLWMGSAIQAEGIGMEHGIKDPENPYARSKVRVHFRCLRCGSEYSRIYAAVPSRDAPCLKKACRESALKEQWQREQANLASVIEHGAPGIIGANQAVKAVDMTAKIVMEDHGLTDLKDNIRTGDDMAPKLPPPMQKAADGFFGGSNMVGRGGVRTSKQAELLGRRAMAGAFRTTALNPSHVIGGRPGEAAIRYVGSEKLK